MIAREKMPDLRHGSPEKRAKKAGACRNILAQNLLIQPVDCSFFRMHKPVNRAEVWSSMKEFKSYVMKNFEGITVLAILASVVLISYTVDEKMMMLNFYYLPVLVAGYFIGKRASVLVAILSILTVLLFVILNADTFSGGRGIGYLASSISGWSGFLLLTSYIVGALYEQKQRRIEELQEAYVGILEILVKFLESTDRYTKGHSERVAEHAMDIACTRLEEASQLLMGKLDER